MRFVTVWKYCEQQWFQNMAKKVLCIVTVLLSHQTNDVESINFPNDAQHESLAPDFLLHFLRDIISRYTPFRVKMKFQSESTLIPSHKSLKFIFLLSLENGKLRSASFHPNLTRTGR
jgi:hypothetical protein